MKKNSLNKYIGLLTILTIFLLAACGQMKKDTGKADDKIKIVTTFYPKLSY